MRVDFKITGVPSTLVKFKLLDQTVRNQSLKAMARASAIVETRAKENISGQHGHTMHIKTGNLRRNIKSKAQWKGNYEIEGFIGTDVPYAPWIESLPDGGFLYPALMEVGRTALEYFKLQMSMAVRGTL